MPEPASAKDDLAGAAAGGTARAQHADPGEKAVLDDVFAGAREAAQGGDSGKPEALYPAGVPSSVEVCLTLRDSSSSAAWRLLSVITTAAAMLYAAGRQPASQI